MNTVQKVVAAPWPALPASASPSAATGTRAKAGEPGGSCMLWLDQGGLIVECGESIQALFGYTDKEIVGRNISLLFPELADTVLAFGDTINPRLAFLCRCGISFQGVAHDGTETACTLFINWVHLTTGNALGVIVRYHGNPVF